MIIKILFDKVALDKNIRIGWGLSFLINGRILFDTGEKGEWLLENMRILGVDINKIEEVVISHDHWDHQGGLWELLKKRSGLKVYACPGFSKEFREKVKELKGVLIEAKKVTEIMSDIYITGEIAGIYRGKYMPEQAVVLKTKKGITIITGCAHPGIIKMIKKIKDGFAGEPIYFVLGGFHLMESDQIAVEKVADNFKELGVLKTAPMHCSGDVAQDIFRRKYLSNYVVVNSGQEIEV